MDEILITVPETFFGQRIDKALSELTEFTRSHIQKILENGEVTVRLRSGVYFIVIVSTRPGRLGSSATVKPSM